MASFWPPSPPPPQWSSVACCCSPSCSCARWPAAAASLGWWTSVPCWVRSAMSRCSRRRWRRPTTCTGKTSSRWTPSQSHTNPTPSRWLCRSARTSSPTRWAILSPDMLYLSDLHSVCSQFIKTEDFRMLWFRAAEYFTCLLSESFSIGRIRCGNVDWLHIRQFQIVVNVECNFICVALVKLLSQSAT